MRHGRPAPRRAGPRRLARRLVLGRAAGRPRRSGRPVDRRRPARTRCVDAPFTDLAGDAAHVADGAGTAGSPGGAGRALLRRGGGRRGGARATSAAVGVRRRVLPGRRARAWAHQTDVEYPPLPIGGAIQPGDEGLLLIDPTKAVECFYAECPPAAADAAVARLCPQPGPPSPKPRPKPRGGPCRSTYVLCSRDRRVHPLHQAAMAERCRRGRDPGHRPLPVHLRHGRAWSDVLEGVARA